ncbi:MAG: hypothetical protein AAB935_01490, partial [Patescibacteria group bacterium]
ALSRRPIIYTLIGGVAIVLFWRGVWLIADELPFMTGFVSLIISVAVLLLSGLFVSFFIGEEIIISGLKKERKLFEKTESEIKAEADILNQIKIKIEKIEEDLQEFKQNKKIKK